MLITSFHYRYRKQILIGTLIGIVLIIFISIGVYSYVNNKTKEKNISLVVEKKKSTEEKNVEKNNNEIEQVEEKVIYQVDIKGEVIFPGIYSLEESSRVIDVINMAGGLTENANTTVINLSKKIYDEMVIIIYSNSEVEDFKKTKEIEAQVMNSCIQKDENSLHNDACITTEEDMEMNKKISINTASKEEIMTLPGLGEAKAQSIIDYRNQNGSFENIEDIMNVSGIGESLFAQIKEYITT